MTSKFGLDLACVSDLTSNLGVVSGRRLLAEAVVRRLTTPRGTLIDDPNYGVDLREWALDTMTAAQMQRVPAIVDAELQKDERIIASTTSATFLNGVLSITVALVDADGPFTLTANVSALTVDNLKVTS